MLKVNDTVEYRAESYANAETAGKVNGVTVFVPNLIVGERALVKINYIKKDVAYADVVRIIDPSSQRVNPPCKKFGSCGGCSLMHMSYGEQLAFKREKVANNIRKIGKLNVEPLPCVASDEVINYRNKLSLPIRGVKGSVEIGMFAKNTHSLVNCDNCFIAGDWSKKLIYLFRRYMNEYGVEPYDEVTFGGEARHLVARYLENQLLVTVVSNGAFKHDLQPFADMLKKEFGSFGLFVNENTLKNNVILGKTTKHICGIEYIQGEHLGVKFRLRPNSFFQVNGSVKDKIYLKARRLLDLNDTEVLVDCFSGVGVLTNVLASDKYITYAVEIEPSAVKDAEEMRILNNANIVNICGDVNVELPKITAKHRGAKMTLVADPPRKGLGESICNAVIQAGFTDIAYISCDSATLARDLRYLSKHYDVTYVEPYDMFPQTDQVETLVHLARKVNS